MSANDAKTITVDTVADFLARFAPLELAEVKKGPGPYLAE